MNWFESLTDFREENPEQVRSLLEVRGDILVSCENGKKWRCGELETLSLGELQESVDGLPQKSSAISVREIVADAQQLHIDPLNNGALFQAASQCNLLEMVSPDVTPERGVGIYEHDPTQGPACATAAGAGTIYRNYFAEVNGHIGQSASNQIDCLADLGVAFGNNGGHLWHMKNGYCLATEAGLSEISEILSTCDEDQTDDLRKLLRIGIQWNTQVTIGDSDNIVSQAYCSALPIVYSSHSAERWEKFARIVLEATCEATICAGIFNAEATGNRSVFITLVGGGVFRNKGEWIIDAIERALTIYPNYQLDVAVVSRNLPQEPVRELIDKITSARG